MDQHCTAFLLHFCYRYFLLVKNKESQPYNKKSQLTKNRENVAKNGLQTGFLAKMVTKVENERVSKILSVYIITERLEVICRDWSPEWWKSS